MKKQCCKKIKDKNEKDIPNICIECLLDNSYLADILGYDDNDQWIKDIKIQISDSEQEFYCILLDQHKKIMQEKSSKTHLLEEQIADIQNDLKYALHDIQAPIRTIRNFAELILENKDSVDIESLIQKIYNNSVNATKMLSDVRDIMILGRRHEEYRTVLNFRDIFKTIKENLESVIQEKNAKINVSYKNSIIVKTNISRWIRILQNIILNAIVYNEKENPEIDIWFNEGNVYIKDNGMGIPPDKHEVVFEMFTRLTDRSDMFDGTGAGLFICRKFLEMDGYSISVLDSSPEGTTFIIYPLNHVFS